MSSIFMDHEIASIGPESSISQQAEQHSATGLSESKPDPVSIGEFFIVKEDMEILEEAKQFLDKGSNVCQLLDLTNCTEYSG
jgi:hypothetical protein